MWGQHNLESELRLEVDAIEEMADELLVFVSFELVGKPSRVQPQVPWG